MEHADYFSTYIVLLIGWTVGSIIGFLVQWLILRQDRSESLEFLFTSNLIAYAAITCAAYRFGVFN